MSTAPDAPRPPSWDHCGRGTTARDPVGCRGILVPGHTACLAHLADADRATYLASLAPGSDINHSGTPFTEILLNSLLQALQDPATGRPRLGIAQFGGATFSAEAGFGGATFSAEAQFGGATFNGIVWFNGATFNHDAVFHGVTFRGDAVFNGATFNRFAVFNWVAFSGDAEFAGAAFTDTAEFAGAAFTDTAEFAGAIFNGIAEFAGATFNGDAEFDGATFTGWAPSRPTAGFLGATFASTAGFGRTTFEGDAKFDGARFTGTAVFGEAKFFGPAGFEQAMFAATAGFDDATFTGAAEFEKVTFAGHAGFRGATFADTAKFGWATFADASFLKATFTNAWFGGATFTRASFSGAEFADNASFDEVTFTTVPLLGPLVCGGTVDLSGAIFETPVVVEVAARSVHCVRTRWESTATLRLSYATVNLTDAVLSAPTAVTAWRARPRPPAAVANGAAEEERLPAGAEHRVRVTSVHGVDAAHLVLRDVDLAECAFSGAFHLDQLRLEGRCTFASVPSGPRVWRYELRSRWTHRRTLAEEHRWRAARTVGNPNPPGGWHPGSPFDRIPQPADVAATYRELRKGLEDSKNEPGAADFYYGEMEMRRRDRRGTPAAERCLLWAYWLLSGYGQRALRAVCWLTVTMALTVGLLMAFGLPPAPGPTQQSTLTVRPIGLSTAPVDPSGAAPSSWLTLPRFERGTRTALNSAVFRSAGEGLTTIGTYIEMVSRFAEPVLLLLALLAVRNRVKR
ncbi:pentapeptide repeat-containing protein [Kitasatospora sp. NPDC101447]|uniref:pentapeptide repeat-containing protein n=1 Tax=Kitasatospora sp. NPDC101447 TaxID=3364102 RepID=UPI00382821D3